MTMQANKRLKYYQIMKTNPTIFAIPILTALGQAGLTAVGIGITNTLGFIFVISDNT